MNAQIELIEGTNRSTELSQYFTPKRLAERVVEWALRREYPKHGAVGQAIGLGRPMRVLEPSAGNGALVRPLVAAGAEVTAIEIDLRYTEDLALSVNHRSILGDFLYETPETIGTFDLVVGNFPYHDNNEMHFTLHALRFAPRVVGIFRADVFYTVSRGEALWKHVRPTRVAFCSRRPWKGAETDYCVLELVKRDMVAEYPVVVSVEFWGDSW